MYKLLPLALSVMLTACAVGPDYQAPASVPLASFSQADATAEQQASEQRFWSGFNDPQLAALVDRALAQNLDVQTLLARYQGAEALLRGARRDRWPSVTLQAVSRASAAAAIHPAVPPPAMATLSGAALSPVVCEEVCITAMILSGPRALVRRTRQQGQGVRQARQRGWRLLVHDPPSRPVHQNL